MNVGDSVTVDLPGCPELHGKVATVLDISAPVFPPNPSPGAIMLKLALQSDPTVAFGLFASQVTV